MKLYVTTEKRLRRAGSGRILTDNDRSTGYRFWRRYLDVFDEVVVMARVASEHLDDGADVEGERVRCLPLPDYRGIGQFLAQRSTIAKVIATAASDREPAAYLVRAPTTFGDPLVRALRGRGRAYGVEVIGDPYDVLAPGAISHPLRPMLRQWARHRLRRQVGGARVVSYVTSEHLQRRYPPAATAYATHYSSIELPSSAYTRPRNWTTTPATPRILFVGSLAQLYKAPDVLLDAVASVVVGCRTPVHLTVIGGGKYLPDLQERSRKLGIEQNVTFRGQVGSQDEIFHELDLADLFVLPSRTEGLPRAMIEAMARGLPCIGTNVGGIPELLGAEELVAVGDAAGLAQKMIEIVSDPARLRTLSARNVERATRYRADELTRRRRDLYGALRTAVEGEWPAATNRR